VAVQAVAVGWREADSRRWEADSKRREADSGRWEVDSGRREAGSGRLWGQDSIYSK